jgi:hypothetical protein
MPPIARLLMLMVILCISSPYPASAWWATGHEAIARLAAGHLMPEARMRIARIFGISDSEEAVAEALARESTWADRTKVITGTGAWHFIDLGLEDRRSDLEARCPGENCAPARIRIFAAQLASGASGTAGRDALRYVVHLVGDIHQPLHTISNADLGGNCERLAEPAGRVRTLHALWDGGLVDALEPDPVRLAEALERFAGGMEPGAERELARGSVEDWVWEAHEIAVNDVYGRLRIPPEPEDFPASCAEAPEGIREFRPDAGWMYVEAMKPVVRSQLVKAGLRLAALLNAVF